MDLVSGRALALPPRVQFAGLPFRHTDDGVEYLLITSRDTGRWIIPKGWPIKSGDARETVMLEVWEEAGIYGHMHGEPVGEYSYDKVLDHHSVRCQVVVYPVMVAGLADDFPESAERRREWFPAKEAGKLVREPDLRALFHGRLDQTIRGLSFE